MADVYHRLRNQLEGLIAYACAIAGDPDVDVEEAWAETNGLARLLRDLGFFDLAREVHATAGDLLRAVGLMEPNQHRHDFLGLQIDAAEVLRAPERIPALLPDLLARVMANATGLLARNDDDAAPVAILFGQLLRIAKETNTPLPQEATPTLAALLERTGGSTSSIVRATSSTHPSAADVLLLHQETETVRYSEDAGYDAHRSSLPARRLLGRGEKGCDPKVAALAIELLADRAIAAPGWETTSRPCAPIANVDQSAAVATAISTQGAAIVMAALDVEGRLVRVTAAGGELQPALRESTDVFSMEQFRSWSREFPYRYGVDEKTLNLFHSSSEHLGVSALPGGRVVLVLDTELQQLSPNLLRIDDDFAGRTRAMGSAPSLSWLAAARKQPRTAGRMEAWISTKEKRGRTLAMIAERLAETLMKYNIGLDRGAALPRGLAGAELVVVAAHGGILPGGRFFQRVSDEGDLNIAGAEFASALRNVGVVILFVCSGGRADKHPSASTTVGLAKQLLDRGCSAVIASPWPLDARVTYHWLPVFLEKWKGGVPLIDANFYANLAVSEAFSADPAKCLAMTVFGDPLRTAEPRDHEC